MKKECEIVRDILPLYVDGVCSDASREIIVDHLKECPDCKEELTIRYMISEGLTKAEENNEYDLLHGLEEKMKSSYKKLYGKEPEVMAIHAGLECGIIGGIYPGLDMISFGPTLKSPHSPDERCHIPSVQRTWDLLKAILENIPEK